MRILIANLKLFYQRRLLWAAYLGLLGLALAAWVLMHIDSAARAGVKSTAPAEMMLLTLAIGSLIGNMRRRLTSRVACFTLPGHQLVWRQLTFLIGSVIAFAGAFVFVACVLPNSLSLGAPILAFLVAFAVHLTIYLIGACMASGFAGIPSVPIIIAVCLPYLALYGRIHPDSLSAVMRAIIGFSGPVIASSTLAAVIVWLWLGRRRRRWRSGPPERLRGIHLPGEGFLLERTRRCKYLASAKYVWGTFYSMALPGHPWRPSALSLFLSGALCSVFGAYLGARVPVYMLAALFAIAISYSRHLPLYAHIPPTVGREERFLATMAALTVLTFTTVLTMAVPIAMSDLLAPFLPEFQVAGLKISYAPMSLWLVMLPVVAVPVGSLCNLAFDSGSCEHLFSIGLVFAAILITGHVVCSWTIPVPLVCVVILTVVPWGLCALGVRHVAMRSDLVPRGRRA